MEVSAADRFDALREGRINLLCGPITQTLTWRETLDFSIPSFIDSMGAAFRAGPVAEIVSYESRVDGLEALAAEEIAARFGDQASLAFQFARLRPKALPGFAPRHYSFEPCALTMKRGVSRLRLAVDGTFSRVFASGTISRR